MVKFTAKIASAENQHDVTVSTNENTQVISIAPKSGGFGSSMNGAEALLLALATCYCNDFYREAKARDIRVTGVQVSVDGDYDGVAGHPITNITYDVSVQADAPPHVIEQLIRETDTLAEIQNTLRQGASVLLNSVTAISNDEGG